MADHGGPTGGRTTWVEFDGLTKVQVSRGFSERRHGDDIAAGNPQAGAALSTGTVIHVGGAWILNPVGGELIGYTGVYKTGLIPSSNFTLAPNLSVEPMFHVDGVSDPAPGAHAFIRSIPAGVADSDANNRLDADQHAFAPPPGP